MTRIDTGEEATVLNYVGGQYWGYYAWPFTRFFNHLDYCLGWPASGNISMQFSNLEFWDTAPSSFRVTVDDYLSHSDVSYGSDAEHTMDVYSSGRPDAPCIVMVHGGFWVAGDKANASVVDNKVLYWCGRGYTVIYINYRLNGLPLQQVLDIESAIDYIKANAATYDIDTAKIILMGHSSGGHIATLFAITRPTEIAGAVILDSAVMDMDDTMNNTHVAAFDTIFGVNQAYWNANSPKYQWANYNDPTINLTHTLVVSSTISAQMTAQNTAFATQVSGTLLSSDLDHDSTNSDLGLYGEYTQSVSDFIDALVA
jgi:acetyl esterase/lipase